MMASCLCTVEFTWVVHAQAGVAVCCNAQQLSPEVCGSSSLFYPVKVSTGQVDLQAHIQKYSVLQHHQLLTVEATLHDMQQLQGRWFISCAPRPMAASSSAGCKAAHPVAYLGKWLLRSTVGKLLGWWAFRQAAARCPEARHHSCWACRVAAAVGRACAAVEERTDAG